MGNSLSVALLSIALAVSISGMARSQSVLLYDDFVRPDTTAGLNSPVSPDPPPQWVLSGVGASSAHIQGASVRGAAPANTGAGTETFYFTPGAGSVPTQFASIARVGMQFSLLPAPGDAQMASAVMAVHTGTWAYWATNPKGIHATVGQSVATLSWWEYPSISNGFGHCDYVGAGVYRAGVVGSAELVTFAKPLVADGVASYSPRLARTATDTVVLTLPDGSTLTCIDATHVAADWGPSVTYEAYYHDNDAVYPVVKNVVAKVTN